MRASILLLIALAGSGCATQRQAGRLSSPTAAEKPLVQEAAATRVVETRYEMRSYRDADNPSVRHEPHAVYRATRVPTRSTAASSGVLETVPREKYAPASHAPLPQTAELTAELATQKQITSELQSIRASMATLEKQAQDQYGALINQTAETIKLRQQLEQERARIKELQSKLHADAPTSTPVTASLAAGNSSTAEVKW